MTSTLAARLKSCPPSRALPAVPSHVALPRRPLDHPNGDKYVESNPCRTERARVGHSAVSAEMKTTLACRRDGNQPADMGGHDFQSCRKRPSQATGFSRCGQGSRAAGCSTLLFGSRRHRHAAPSLRSFVQFFARVGGNPAGTRFRENSSKPSTALSDGSAGYPSTPVHSERTL
jgi:hypothetical protein